MKKINVKNILIIMLILVEVIATYFMYKSGTNKEVVLDNVELKELTDNNSFAIYLDGKEYNQTTWPESAAFQKAECQNEKGDILNGVLTFNEEENKAYINNTTQTTYCYLYFKSCNGPVGTVLADKPQVSSCEVGGMYRYQGTDDVNNYICFGTTDKSTCTSNASKYMYRIIGVTPEGELKLIKETALIAKKAPEWNYSDSTMRNSINGSDFLTNSDYLSKVWQDLIVSHNWLYGFTGKVNSPDFYDGNYMYEIESGQKEVTYDSNVEYSGSGSYSIKTTTKKWDTSVSDKVGLLYTHDYLFAYPGGNPGSNNNLKTIWLAPNIPEFIITAQGITDPGVEGHIIYLWVNSLTTDHSNYSWLQYSHHVTDFGLRPVFYLNKDVIFKTGTGTSTDPYILNVIDDTPAPTCSFSMTSAGSVIFTKSANATKWYIGTSDINPNDDSKYQNITNSSFPPVTTYGYVKNSSGKIGSCKIEVTSPQSNSCSVTGSTTQSGKCTAIENDTRHPCSQVSSSTSDVHCSVNSTSNFCAQYQSGCCEKGCSCNTCISHTCVTHCSNGNDYSSSASDSSSACSASRNTCYSANCGTTSYRCEGGYPCSSEGCCANFTCGSLTYSCSNGETYSSASQCTSLDCNNTVYTCSDGNSYVNESGCTSKICSSCATGYTPSGNYCYKNL